MIATAQQVPFAVEYRGKNVARVTFDTIKEAGEWVGWALVRSDVHHDSRQCDQKLERKLLEQARERQAVILDLGDYFDVMQGPNDRRASRSALRDEHFRGVYFDEVIDEAVEFNRGYEHNFGGISNGNHETAVIKHYGIDLTAHLTKGMRHNSGAPVKRMGYTGWYQFKFQVHTVRSSVMLWYHHGYGGGGPVTKDMIQRARQKERIEGANIMASGHTHDLWQDSDIVERLNSHGKIQRRKLLYLKCGTCKDAMDGTGGDGWENERGMPAKPLGHWWLRFVASGGEIHYTAHEADGRT